MGSVRRIDLHHRPRPARVADLAYGGWSVNYWDDEMMGRMAEADPYELLLFRGTYEIFAAHWPYVTEDPIADRVNGTRKHVASTTLEEVEWNNSTLITGVQLGADPADRSSRQFRGCCPVSGLHALVRLLRLSALLPHPARWRRTAARSSGALSPSAAPPASGCPSASPDRYGGRGQGLSPRPVIWRLVAQCSYGRKAVAKPSNADS
jgi:hypothetical protein